MCNVLSINDNNEYRFTWMTSNVNIFISLSWLALTDNSIQHLDSVSVSERYPCACLNIIKLRKHENNCLCLSEIE